MLLAIRGIVDQHCLNFFFHNYIEGKLTDPIYSQSHRLHMTINISVRRPIQRFTLIKFTCPIVPVLTTTDKSTQLTLPKQQ